MEMDSKPESMDRLERRLIQQKMEIEALKKETDDASKKRLEESEAKIADMERDTHGWLGNKTQHMVHLLINESSDEIAVRAEAIGVGMDLETRKAVPI